MATFGSIDILTRLMGGQEVIKQLKEIQQYAKTLEARPITVKVNLAEVDKAAQKARSMQIKSAEDFMFTEKDLTKRLERELKVREQAAAGAARAAESTDKQRLKQNRLDDEQLNAALRARQQITLESQRAQAESIAAFQSRLTGVGNLFTSIGNLGDKFAAVFFRIGDGITHAGQIMGAFAYRLSLLAIPFEIVLTKAVQFGVEFQALIAKAATQLDASGAQIAQFVDTASTKLLELSKVFPVLADDMAKALYFIVSSTRLTGDQALAAMEPIAKLATAGATTAESISKAVAVAFSVFGDELGRFGDYTAQATHIVETFWAAIKKGKAEVDDVATAFPRLAQFVKSAGGTFEEATAMWAIMTRAFTAPQAATAIENFAKAIIKPSDDAAAAFEALGIKLSTAEGQIRPFMTVLGELFDKVREFTPADQAKLLATIFPNIRGEQAALFFSVIQNYKDAVDLQKQMLSGTTGLDDAVTLMLGNTKTAFTLLQSNFNAFGQALFDQIEPSIRSSITAIVVALDKLAKNPAVINFIVQFGAALAAIVPAALGLSVALLGSGGLVMAIGALLQPAGLFTVAILLETIGPLFRDAAKAVQSFGGGINGVIGFITEFARQMGLISDSDAAKIFKELGATVSPEATRNVSIFVQDVRNLLADANKFKDDLIQVANGIGLFLDRIQKGQGIVGAFYSAFKGIATTLSGLLGFGAGGNIAEGVAGGLDVALGTIIGSKIAGALLRLVVPLMNVVAANVNLSGGGLLGAGMTLLGGAGGGASIGGIAATVAAVLAVLGLSIAVIKASYDDLTRREGRNVTFTETIANVPSTVGTFVDEFRKFINESVKLFFQSISNWITTAFANIVASLDNGTFVALIVGSINALGQAIADAINGAIYHLNVFMAQTFGFAMPAGSPVSPAVTRHISEQGLPRETLPYGYKEGMAAAAGVATTPYGYEEGMAATGVAPAKFGGVSGGRHFFTKEELDAMKKAAEKLEKAAKTIYDAISKLVEKALEPTEVTAEDIEATKLGKYKDKADEFRRRVLAVAAGTDATIYGKAFQQQLEKVKIKFPHLSLEEIADQFKDFSLFADMSDEEIDELWNWDAIIASVERGINAIIGHFKVMRLAIEKVLADLPQAKLFDLAEALGIEGAGVGITDLQEKIAGRLQGILGGAVSSVKATAKTDISATFKDDADKNIKTYAEWIKQIPNSIVTTIALKLADDFQEVADAITTWLNSLPTTINIALNIGTNISGGVDKGVNVPYFHAPTAGGGGGSPNKKQAGGYAEEGLYHLGEQGREYVLPANIVAFIERILGHKISSPEEIFKGIGLDLSRFDEYVRYATDFLSNTSAGAENDWIHWFRIALGLEQYDWGIEREPKHLKPAKAKAAASSAMGKPKPTTKPKGGGQKYMAFQEGGYASYSDWYKLAEAGREYILPTRVVQFMEGMLGHQIQSPYEIQGLVSSNMSYQGALPSLNLIVQGDLVVDNEQRMRQLSRYLLDQIKIYRRMRT